MAGSRRSAGGRAHHPDGLSPLSEDDGFIFVTYTNTTPPKDAARAAPVREIVRRRAMQAYHEHGGNYFPSDRNPASQIQSIRDNVGRFRLDRTAQQTTEAGSSKTPQHFELASPINTHLSTLEPHLRELGPEAWRLLEYYRYGLHVNSIIPNTMRSKFTFFLRDAATSHAILSFASLNRDLLQGDNVSPVTLYHRSAAIALMRAKLSDTSAERETEIIAGTVALLALSESLEGNEEHCSAHIKGLSTIIKYAGGLDTLMKKAPPVICLLAQADLSYSSNWPLHASFENTHFSKNFHMSLAGYQIGPRAEEPIFDFEWNRSQLHINDLLTPNLVEALTLLRLVPTGRQLATMSPSKHMKNTSAVQAVERTLITYREEDTTTVPMHLFSNVFHSAAHLYLSVALRDLPIRARIVASLGKRLTECVQQLEEVVRTEPTYLPSRECQSILLWSCIVQLTVMPAIDPDSASVSLILEMLKILQLSTVDALLEELRRITWAHDFMASNLAKLIELSSAAEV